MGGSLCPCRLKQSTLTVCCGALMHTESAEEEGGREEGNQVFDGTRMNNSC